MTLPAFLPSGVLPPFLDDPASLVRSPYRCSMVEVARTFGTTAARRRILHGLLRYRAELRRVGVGDGFQWLDGSFAERRGAEPKDVDVVTFAKRVPPKAVVSEADRALFDPDRARAEFSCDAYFVSLGTHRLVDVVTYWYGLLSHRRDSFEWKGMVRVELDDVEDDARAREALAQPEAEEVTS
jgi:hypothetical protein